MPLASQKSTSQKSNLKAWLKSGVILCFFGLLLILAADRIGLQLHTEAASVYWQDDARKTRAQAPRRPQTDGRTASEPAVQGEQPDSDTTSVPSALMDDCSFLQNPEKFKDALARHRESVVRDTERVATAKELNSLLSLANPADLPRKNYIDTILFDRMSRDRVMSAPLCTDEEYIRRAYLDLTGRIPAPEAVTAFLANTATNKRDTLVDTLIGTPEYVDKWTMFFGDLLQNNANNQHITRYSEGREAFYNYIKNSIATNKNYAQMATEMLNANGDSLLNGEANWLVGAHISGGPAQDVYDGLNVSAATMFLGLNSMDCLLCHDGRGHLSEINLWGGQRTRAEAWAMSAFFARARKTRVDGETPAAGRFFKYTVSEATSGDYTLNTTSGNRQARAPINGVSNVQPKFILNGGGLNTGENRRQAIARLITSDKQFARATVNYIWEKMMVEGLVSPSNSFDPARLDPNAQLPTGWTLQPANAELLEALTNDFIQSNYNLQFIIGRIAKSNAYQLSAQYPGTWSLALVPYYARKYVRRLDAEEIHDAIVKATGIGVSYQIRTSVGTTARTVNWAMQLPDTTGGTNDFLNSFMRGDRDGNRRSQESTLLQSLNMMNHSFISSRIHQSNTGSNVGKLITNTALSSTDIIKQLYLNTLSRNPTNAEIDTLLPSFSTLGRREAAESLQWVLLNKMDFIYNY